MLTRIHRQSGVLKAKDARAIPASGRVLAFAAAVFLFGAAPGARAQGFTLGDEIISDEGTGAALLGFDPVAYFFGSAVAGNPARQALHAGKIWYFQSEANRAAFLASPEVYLPAFGGHDPVAVAAGFAVSGSPEIFAIAQNRVYLFRRAEAREAFLRDATIAETARRNWPQVKRDMVP